MKILALKGKNGSGKSTVATMLSQKLTEKGISNKVLAFADPLKKIATHNINWEDREQKELNRGLLESWAKTMKTIFSFNPFIEEMQNSLVYKATHEKIVIVSDLRFTDEYKFLYDWQNDIPGLDDKLIVIEIKNTLTNNNPPEYDLDAISSDKIINFDSSLEKQLEEIINQIL